MALWVDLMEIARDISIFLTNKNEMVTIPLIEKEHGTNE